MIKSLFTNSGYKILIFSQAALPSGPLKTKLMMIKLQQS